MAVHAVVLSLIVSAPETPSARPRGVYEQVFAANEKKLVWYRFDQKLPEVSPLDRRSPPEPVRARERNPQEISVQQNEGRPARQMTWSPAPRLNVEQDLDAPNLLAFETPRVQPPRRPKLFTPPAPASLAAPAPLTAEAAPVLEAALSQTSPFATPARPARPFTPPPLQPRTATSRLDLPPLPEGPAALTGTPPLVGKVARPVRPFTTPTARQGAAASLELAPLPQQPVSLAGPNALRESTPRPVRAFTPPVRPSGLGDSVGGPSLDREAPDVPATDANLTAAVIGLNPSTQPYPIIPEGSRPAEISAGPAPSPAGGGGAPVDSARVFVPGVMIRGGSREARPTLLARAIIAPTSPEALAEVSRSLSAQAPLLESQRGAPASYFEGREVYTLAMQAANVTSYSGSWMLWFAAREQPGGAGDVQAPFPVRKVDPVYAVSAMDEHIEGVVRLGAVIRRDGQVDFVTLLRGRDARLDQGAITALRKWEFVPARRNGEPIDVDVVVDIPFRLAPAAKP